MKKRFLEITGSVIALALFTLALWVLHRELANNSLADIIARLRSIPIVQLLLALLFAALNYFVLSGYDRLGLHYVKHPVEYPKVAMTSFITYTISHNLGFSVLTGGSLRYRIYGAWGLSAYEVTSLMGFGVVTFWLGYLTTSAIVLTSFPLTVPSQIRLPFATTFPLGLLMAVVLLGYLVWIFGFRRSIRIKDWQFALPTGGQTFVQMGLGVLEWLTAAAAVYVLLPHTAQVNYLQVLAIYLLAQIVGLISHVPGGLGVFESVFLVLVGSSVSSADVLGSLLAFRIVYYLLPLVVAAAALATFEVSRRTEGILRIAGGFSRWISAFSPQLFSFLIFLAGAVLLVSSATPTESERLGSLARIVPLALVEVSHIAASLAGLGLLLLARGLQRRVDAAYVWSLILLSIGVVAGIAKGVAFAEAAVLLLVILVLLPSRPYFYRKVSLMARTLSPAWVGAIAVVIACSIWLTVFSNKHVDFDFRLLWQFDTFDEAARTFRAAAIVVCAAITFAIWRLLRKLPPEPAVPTGDDLEHAAAIISTSSSSLSQLARLGDKELLFSQSGRAFIMYGTAGQSWVALGDPVGPREEWRELMWQFHELADRHGGRTAFYQVDSQNMPLYLDMDLSLLKLGEEARVSLAGFSLEGHPHKQLRHWHRRPENDGYTFEVTDPGALVEILPQLREVSDRWLVLKNTREKGFSLGSFHEPYLAQTPLALVRREGRIVAFANILATEDRKEMTVDLVRHLPDVHSGLMDYLLIELMLWGKQQRYRWFSLGMAPLVGLENNEAAPFWNRLGTSICRHGDHFYDFSGLRQYKEKFHPIWTPRYLASSSGVAVLAVLTDIAAMITGRTEHSLDHENAA